MEFSTYNASLCKAFDALPKGIFRVAVSTQDTSADKDPYSLSEDDEKDFKPLTAAEAAEWRKRNPMLSVWQIVLVQLVVGVMVVAITAALSRNTVVALSAAYGVLVVVVPAIVFARGVVRQKAQSASVMAFAVWELAKLLLAIALLVMAPKFISNLNWLALVASMIVTMNVYWVVLFVRPRSV